MTTNRIWLHNRIEPYTRSHRYGKTLVLLLDVQPQQLDQVTAQYRDLFLVAQ